MGFIAFLYLKKQPTILFLSLFSNTDWQSVATEYGTDGNTEWEDVALSIEDVKLVFKDVLVSSSKPSANAQMPSKFFLLQIMTTTGEWLEITVGDRGELYYASADDLSHRQFWTDNNQTVFTKLMELGRQGDGKL